VAAAVRELEKIGAAFTVADVRRPLRISRATIYRNHALRMLWEQREMLSGRSIPTSTRSLMERHRTLKSKMRELRQRTLDAEASWEEMRERMHRAEARAAHAERAAAAAEQAARTPTATGLEHVAANSALKPSVAPAEPWPAPFTRPITKDEAAFALATELLKALNT